MKDKEIKEEVLKEEINKEVNEKKKCECEEGKEEVYEYKNDEYVCCGKYNYKEEIEKFKVEIEEWKNSFLRK